MPYTFPIPVSQVFPLKNGDLLVVGSTFPGFEALYKGDKKFVKAYFDDKKENEDYEVISQLPWWWNGGTYTRGAYESLFYYDAKKKSLTRLTDADFNVSDVQLAEDQKTVYFSLLDVSVPRPAHFGGQDLYRIDLASRRQELVVKSRPDFVIATYALGKSFLLVMAADGKFGMNTDCDFYKLDYETLAVTPYAVYGEAIRFFPSAATSATAAVRRSRWTATCCTHLDALRRRRALQARRRHRLPRPRARRQRRQL